MPRTRRTSEFWWFSLIFTERVVVNPEITWKLWSSMWPVRTEDDVFGSKYRNHRFVIESIIEANCTKRPESYVCTYSQVVHLVSGQQSICECSIGSLQKGISGW